MKALKLMIAAAAMMSLAAQAQERPFTIDGYINGMEGQKLYLFMEGYNDSCVVSNGKFQFKGAVDDGYHHAYLMDMAQFTRETKAASIDIEPAAMTVGVNVYDFGNPVVTGSKSQLDNDRYNAMVKEDMAVLTSLNNQYYAAETQAEKDSIERLSESFRKHYMEQNHKFMTENPDAYISARLLHGEASGMDLNDLETAYNNLTPRVKAVKFGEEVAKEIKARRVTQPGMPAPDFTKTDINGKTLSLSQFRGKWVILDFWASWCVPCRKSNPHMIALYNKYHDKGLEFIFIADDDSKLEAWHKAVEKDGLQKMHHVLRGFKLVDREKMIFDRTEDLDDMYAIHTIPTKYLIDPQGNIVARYN